MKNKYQRKSKEEKKTLHIEYRNSERGKSQLPRLYRLLSFGILGLVVTAALVIYAILNDAKIWDYLYAGGLFVFSIIFIISSLKIRSQEYNKFALTKK